MATNPALTDPICQTIKDSCSEPLENTQITENRETIFSAIIDKFIPGMGIPDHKQAALIELLRFFGPFFAGNNLAAEGDVDLSVFDKLVATLHEHFKSFCCFLEVLENVFQEKFPLPDIILELIDPLHRPGTYLWKHYLKWDQTTGFFTWLKNMDPSYDKQVQYHLSDDELAAMTASFEEGKIYINSKVADSTHLDGKRPGHFAFALLTDGRLLLRQHEKGRFQHSSFASGGPVACTGMVRIVDGKITKITNHSGHYRPEKADFRKLFENIPADVFAANATIHIEENRMPNYRDSFLSSSGAWSKAAGHMARDVIKTTVVTVAADDEQETVLAKFDGTFIPSVDDESEASCCGCLRLWG